MRATTINRYFSLIAATVNRVFGIDLSNQEACLELSKKWQGTRSLLDVIGLDAMMVDSDERVALGHVISLIGRAEGDYPNELEYAFGGGCKTWIGDGNEVRVLDFADAFTCSGYKLVEFKLNNIGLGSTHFISVITNDVGPECRYIIIPEAVNLSDVWYDLGDKPEFYDVIEWIGEKVLIDQFPDDEDTLSVFAEFCKENNILVSLQETMAFIEEMFPEDDGIDDDILSPEEEDRRDRAYYSGEDYN